MDTRTIADLIQSASSKLIAPDGIEHSLHLAISEFSEVLEARVSTPNQRARAYNGIGYAYYQLGKLDEALENLEKAIGFNPKLAAVYVNKAAVYNEMGKFNEALLELEIAQRLKETMPNIYALRGDAYRCLGREEEAQNNYKTALQAIANKPKLYRTVADYIGAIRAQKGLALMGVSLYIRAIRAQKGLMGVSLKYVEKRYDYVKEALDFGIPQSHIDRINPVQQNLAAIGR